MTARKFLLFQCHEFDGHFHLVRDGLKPYYALTDIRKNHDWSTNGKPCGTFEADGETWRVCLDYDDQPILPWDDPSYKLETAYLYRLYFVCEDETYDGERADRSQRVKGGTITFRPRWPDMKRREKSETDGKGEWSGPVKDVGGYMDLGRPYPDAQIQGSNIEFDRYPYLLAEAAATFGIPRRYFDEFYRTSNINDAAVYVRLQRSNSGPIYAADGPIARMHSLLESDRSGYWKHVEDNRERPGDYVTSVVDDSRAGMIIRGHEIGKEVKHYYMRNPDNYDPDEFGWHPKLEIGFQTSATDRTIYWDRDDELDRQDLRRELEESLVNTLDWAGFDVTGGEQYHEDAYFDPDDRERRSLKLVDCPLPEIESDQEAMVMRLWGDMNPSDEALVDTLLGDGGKVSPQDAADETGYCYDTILRAVDRLEGFVEHTYGELAIASDYAAQAMLKRVRSAEKQFRRAIGSTVMQVANDAQNVETDAFDRFVQNYDVGIDETRNDCLALLKPRYVAADKDDAKILAREAHVALLDRHGHSHGYQMRIELEDGSIMRFQDLARQGWAGAAWDREEARRKRDRQLEEQTDFDNHGIDHEEIDLEEVWVQFADRGERISYSTLRMIVSQVANNVDHALEALQERGEIVTAEGPGFALAPR